MRVLENGAYILATLRQGQGIITHFGSLLLKQRQLSVRWTKARDPKARVAQRVIMNPDDEECFPELPASEILHAASTDTQLDYAIYSLRKGVQARITDQKLECAKIRVLGNQESMEFSLRAQYLTLAWETTLYSLRYHQQEVQLATDWDMHACIKELSVW